MKVFLSWSGDISLKVACAFREWLPSVIQSIKPYVSSEDIDKGTRWSTDIAKELEQSSFGILCITKSNLTAPWINFEAGALSKAIEKSNVSPFLFGVKRSEVQGPLLQFQSTIFEKEDVSKLVFSINNVIEDSEKLEDAHLKKTFEVWWPDLEKQLKALHPNDEDKLEVASPKVKKQESVILEEILDLVRNQQKLLRTCFESKVMLVERASI
jgi:hypothetical protein